MMYLQALDDLVIILSHDLLFGLWQIHTSNKEKAQRRKSGRRKACKKKKETTLFTKIQPKESNRKKQKQAN